MIPIQFLTLYINLKSGNFTSKFTKWKMTKLSEKQTKYPRLYSDLGLGTVRLNTKSMIQKRINL